MEKRSSVSLYSTYPQKVTWVFNNRPCQQSCFLLWSVSNLQKSASFLQMSWPIITNKSILSKTSPARTLFYLCCGRKAFSKSFSCLFHRLDSTSVLQQQDNSLVHRKPQPPVILLFNFYRGRMSRDRKYRRQKNSERRTLQQRQNISERKTSTARLTRD